MDVEEGLLLNRIALHAADVTPWNVKLSALVKAYLADACLAFGNRAFVSAGVAAQPVAFQRFHQSGAASATF